MASYRIELKKSVAKDLKDVPKADLLKIMSAIQELASDPRPHGSVKLSGSPAYRVRQGNYRIVYEIYDSYLVVCVIKVGHRRDVYR